jgi:septum formation topological specificity factor MinE
MGVVEPPQNKRKTVEEAAAVKFMEDMHCDLVKVIVRHERIDQEEIIVVADEEDDWTTKVESSDEEEEEE